MQGSVMRFLIGGAFGFIAALTIRIWLVSFMHNDLGYFDDESCRLEPVANPFAPTVLPMRSE